MTGQGIETPGRFLYLNIYAFILLFGGIGFLSFSFLVTSWWLICIFVLLFLECEREACRIFHSWQSKKRVYDILMRRNTPQLVPQSFKEYICAPCGRLMVRLVLKDLGCPDRFPELSRTLVRKQLASDCPCSCCKQPSH